MTDPRDPTAWTDPGDYPPPRRAPKIPRPVVHLSDDFMVGLALFVFAVAFLVGFFVTLNRWHAEDSTRDREAQRQRTEQCSGLERVADRVLCLDGAGD